MKSYKSVNIETGEPSSFQPFAIAIYLFFFIAQPFVYLVTLGLYNISIDFWLSLAIILLGNILLGLMTAKLIRGLIDKAKEKGFNAVLASILISNVLLLPATAIGYFILRFSGVVAPVVAVFVAHVALDILRSLRDMLLRGYSLKK